MPELDLNKQISDLDDPFNPIIKAIIITIAVS